MQIKNLPLDFIKLKRPSEGIENQKLSTFQNIKIPACGRQALLT